MLVRMLRGRKRRWGAEPDAAEGGRETKETEPSLPRAMLGTKRKLGTKGEGAIQD